MTAAAFRDHLPADRRYDPRSEMWVKRLDDGTVRIGATAFGLFLAGPLLAFTPKPRGAEVDRGRGLGTVETGKTVLAVHSPLSVTVLASNDAAEENPALIMGSPYDEGWMILGAPRDYAGEAADLVDAAAYRAHCRSMAPDALIDCDEPAAP